MNNIIFSDINISNYEYDIIELLLKNKDVNVSIRAKIITEYIRRDYNTHETYNWETKEEKEVFYL